MQNCIKNSLNFGIYIKKKQIGYARVITDYAEFAYIVDVFISEGHRDKGLGKLLMEHILSFSELNTIKIWRLTTTDSHGFYQKFGFKELANTSRFMELVTKSKLEE
jgi:GNAT superfamily N-acetyltransferase